MSTRIVFYSWQSDLPRSLNREFIEECLRRTLEELRTDVRYPVALYVDRGDCDGCGTTDGATAIFAEIETAHAFVCDVSFIDEGATGRRTPNPNVLVELGYAAKCLGWGKIVCLFNGAFGSKNDLPYFVRRGRLRCYDLFPGGDETIQRELLVGCLKSDLAGILHDSD